MKTSNKFMLAAIAGVFASTAANAQVELTITGSTAFRSIMLERTSTLMKSVNGGANYSAVTNNNTTGFMTFRGNLPSLASSLVTVRFTFSGSAEGMIAVQNQQSMSTVQGPNPTDLVNKPADVALSDAFPSSATPPIPDSSFSRYVVGIVPFVFAANKDLVGVENLTRDQAVLLLTASGPGGMPSSFLGGVDNNSVFFAGRDPLSGTRIVSEKCIGFTGAPALWATNGIGGYISSQGYTSGGNLRNAIAGGSHAIGYLGLADFNVVASSAKALAYNGVTYTPANVANGSYAIWGYEHMMHRAGGLSANQLAAFNDIKNFLTDATYQSTVPAFTNSFISVSAMNVTRGADGGVITSQNW